MSTPIIPLDGTRLILAVNRLSALVVNFQVPSRVLNALFLAWNNAWVTQGRFQDHTTKCVFCEEWLSDNTISHYSTCRDCVGAAQHFLQIPRPSSITRFLCLQEENPDITIRRTVHLYCLKSSIDSKCGPNNWYYHYRATFVRLLASFPKLRRRDFRFGLGDDFFEAIM